MEMLVILFFGLIVYFLVGYLVYLLIEELYEYSDSILHTLSIEISDFKCAITIFWPIIVVIALIGLIITGFYQTIKLIITLIKLFIRSK